MPSINIDSSALKGFTRKLEELRKSALPRAVMLTLNDAAFDLKMNTMPKSASKTFVQRNKTFFKANSKVEKARSGSIYNMKSAVGFLPKDPAVKELEQQEHGGKIGGRSFITTKHARISKKWDKLVTNKSRTTAINNLVNADDSKGVNDRQKFIKASRHAGKGGYVLHSNKSGNKTFLSRIKQIKEVKNKKTGKRTIVKVESLYSYEKGRAVEIKNPTGFMKKASLSSANKLNPFFIKNANKIISQYKSR